MSEKIKCDNCGHKIGEVVLASEGWIVHVGMRADKRFCSKACTAAYHRTHDKPHIHSDLERHLIDECAVCGELFRFNDYANRSGKRQPLYCSNKCRQKAYRERGKPENAPGNIRNGHFWVCQTADCGQRRFTEPMGDRCDYCGKTDWLAN